MSNQNTKIFITTSGDNSVGIKRANVTISFDYDFLAGYESSREDIRDEFHDFFSAQLDESCGVRFQDECPDCGKDRYEETHGGKCNNPNCIRNIPEEK